MPLFEEKNVKHAGQKVLDHETFFSILLHKFLFQNTVNPEYFVRTKFSYVGDLRPFVRMKFSYSLQCEWNGRIAFVRMNFSYESRLVRKKKRNKKHTKQSGFTVELAAFHWCVPSSEAMWRIKETRVFSLCVTSTDDCAPLLLDTAQKKKKKKKKKKKEGLCDYVVVRNGTYSCHSVDRAGWQAKMASIEFWIPRRLVPKPHKRVSHGLGWPANAIFFFLQQNSRKAIFSLCLSSTIVRSCETCLMGWKENQV